MGDIATNIQTTVERMTQDNARATRGAFSNTYADNARVLDKLASSAKKVSSSVEAMNTAMFQRARLLERIALANERGDEKEAYFSKKRLAAMDEQIELIQKVNQLETKRNELVKKRQTFDEHAAKQAAAGRKVSAKQIQQHQELLEQLHGMSDEYNTQVRVLQKVVDGVTDVKKANELVSQELTAQNVAFEASMKTRSERMRDNIQMTKQQLDEALSKGIGDGWSSIKGDIGRSLATFATLGGAFASITSALRDMSKDSEEVVNSMYRMGGSMDKVNTSFGNYAVNVAKLNMVQTHLRATAATLNMPVEAVEGMTDAIMEQIRIYDKAGNLSMDAVQRIGSTALGYARATNTDAKEAIGLISTLNNKLGYDHTKQVRAGVSELDDQLQGIQAAVITVNDSLEAAGKGKANIYIEDVAKLMSEAASSTEGFSLSLKGLAMQVSKQIGDARALGATYNEALAQAKTMTDFLTKRNDLVNYKIGNKIINETKSKHGDLVAKGDVEGLTAALQKDYNMKSANEANALARSVISGHGPAAVSAGKLAGGTDAGQELTLSVLADEIRKRMKALPEGQILDPTALAAVGGTMGLDVTSEAGLGLMNMFIQQAEKAKKEGKLETNFLAGEKGEAFKKNLEKAKTENMEKNAPVTPVSMKETLQAVFESPLTKLVLGVIGIGSAMVLQGAALAGIWANTKLMAMNALGDKGGALGDLAKNIAGGDLKGTWKSGKGIAGKGFGTARALMGTKWGKIAALAVTAAGVGYGGYKGYEAYNAHKAAPEDEERRREGLYATIQDPDATKDAKAAAQAELEKMGSPTPSATPVPKEPVPPEANAPTTSATPGFGTLAAGAVATAVPGMAIDAAIKGAMAKKAGSTFAAGAGEAIVGKGLKAGIGELAKGAGAKTAASAIGKVGLRGLPFIGGLISGGITAATTEGPWSRKLMAGGGDMLGSMAGSFLGPLGGIAGGYAGEHAGTALYDALWGNKPETATVTAPTQPPAPTSSAASGSNQATQQGLFSRFGSSNGNVNMPATMKQQGQFITLQIPMAQYMGTTQKVMNKITSTETGLAG